MLLSNFWEEHRGLSQFSEADVDLTAAKRKNPTPLPVLSACELRKSLKRKPARLFVGNVIKKTDWERKLQAGGL